MHEPLTTTQRRIPLGDVDAARIIYFLAPQRWHEELFTGWLQDIGHPLVELIDEGFAVPTVSCSAEYYHPLQLDDWVRLELRSHHVGRSSFAVRCHMYRRSDGLLCVQTSSWHAWARLGGRDSGGVRAYPLPDWLRAALTVPTTADPQQTAATSLQAE